MSNLYIVATPIGNLQDTTVRAAVILLSSELIIAESTSKAGILIEFLKKQFPDIPVSEKRIISLTEDEEEQKIPQVIRLLETNDAALISEAGTPLISDPGFKLVREAVKKGINIVPVPGASSLIAALSGSGLPTDKFFFLGYLPKKEGRKIELLNSAKDTKQKLKTTLIFFESPHRILESLKSIREVFGNTDIVIARELTKIHEEFIRGSLDGIISDFEKKQPKGEIVLLI